MKRNIYIIFFVLCIISFAPICAQKYIPVRLYGQILSYRDNQPVSYAAIVVKSTGKGTVSKINGCFDIELPSDTSTIIISCMGYKTLEVKIVPERLQGTYCIKLEESLTELEEVTVATEKDRIVRVTDNISSVKISPILVARLPNLGEVDIMRSFQLLPGVMATNETSAGLYVRGGTPDQNLILFDGMTIYHVDHFYGFFSAFNVNTIDDIELIKGGFPAKYGGRTSSVMVITGKPADLNKIHCGGSLSLLSVNGFLEVPLIKNKMSWQVAARRSYTDFIRTGLYNKIFNLYNKNKDSGESRSSSMGPMRGMQQEVQEPKLHFYDLNSKFTYKPDNKNTIALSLYNGKDKMDNSMELSSQRFSGFSTTASGGSVADLADWGNTGASIQWKSIWNDKYNSNIFLSYSNYFSRRERETGFAQGEEGPERAGTSSLEDNKVQDVSFRYRNIWNINNYNNLEFGIEESFTGIKYSLSNNDTLTLVDRNDQGLQSSLYLQDEINFFNDKISINAGLRTIHYNITKKFYFEPRVSFIYKPAGKLKFKAAWGMYNQFHTRIIREDVLEGSKDFWLLADDETIPINSSVQYILGMSYEINNFLFDLEAYYNDLKGLTEYSMRYTATPGRGPGTSEQYFFEGTGYSKGIELLIQKKYGKNTGWIGYTLSEVKHTFPDLNYGLPFYALHDQPHELKTVYSRRIKRWDLSAAFIYATGKPYTSPEGEYQLTLLDGSVYNYIHVSEKNSYRLPDYHRLDISVSYNWRGHYTENMISFSIFNLYNRKNVWYKEFEIYENDVIVTDMNLLGITPNLSLTVKF